MRYFQYPNTGENRNNALREQYKTLTQQEKQRVRSEKRWRILCEIVTFVMFGLFMVACVAFLKWIPRPEHWAARMLAAVGKIILGILLLALGGGLTVWATRPLWNKAEAFRLPAMKKEIFFKACGHLRDFYGLQEPCIVTKCFDATDKKFKDHDVCLFVAGEELRITADLLRGFLHGERDLGCYAFRREEITLRKQRHGDRLAVVLDAGGAAFVLGYRAKGFIEKNFIKPEEV